jgi:lipopolysaccharide export system ATP-binding protein
MGLLFNIDKLRHKKDEEIPTLDVTVDDLNNLTEDIAEEGESATEGESEGTPKSEAVPTPEGEAAAEPDAEGEDAEAEAAEEVPEVKKLVLRTDNLVKKYGKRTVANHVSIDVTQGEIVGLLGPNGAGKTTTFYMTVGLVQPNEGRIFLNDLDITKYPVYKRAQNGIGYLAQEPSVFRKLSVEDNIKAVLQMTGRSKEYQREKLENLIAEFRLEKVRKNLGDQLSGGERRRTEIARCLAIDPKFIMLDEPFAGVDPIAVEDIQSIVYKLKEKNIGILITDHNAPETLSITDRAYLLFEGRILFQGSSEELAENPTVREKYLGRNFIFRRKNFD